MEFWMVEPEVAYATLEDTMQLAEGLICFIVDGSDAPPNTVGGAGTQYINFGKAFAAVSAL